MADIMDSYAERMLKLFTESAARDAELFTVPENLRKWLFVDRLYARGERKEMNFYGFDGVEHLKKFFQWIEKIEYPDYFHSPWRDSLIETSVEHDAACLDRLGLRVDVSTLRKVAVYNAQDYILQRFYPVSAEQRPRRIIDFGAGHGRMANLAFNAPNNITDLMVSIDAIPASYLTQRLYYDGLAIKYADYIDITQPGETFSFKDAISTNQLVHLPSWRMDILPSGYFDLVCCVQVLKELPRRALCQYLREFARILKPGGAIYIRDHVQFHDPSHMPIDELLAASGFILEFRPHVKDRVSIHGLPRIWRLHNHEIYLNDLD